MPSSTSARLRAMPAGRAEGDPGERAEERHQHRLASYDGAHLASGAADRAQQPELAGALDDGEHQGVDDAEDGHDHGQQQQRGDDARAAGRRSAGPCCVMSAGSLTVTLG